MAAGFFVILTVSMHQTQTYIGYIAGVLALIQIVPYVLDIMRGHTKPERATYAIWLVVEAVAVSSYIASGARTTIWTGLAYVLAKVIILTLSIKRGVGGFNGFDLSCMAIAAAAIAVWLTTSDPKLALYLSIGALAIGYIPLFRKIYLYPNTENIPAWIISTIAGGLNLFALSSLAPRLVLLPLVIFIADATVVYMLFHPTRKRAGRPRKKTQPSRPAVLFGGYVR
jgi:hypothetical protein